MFRSRLWLIGRSFGGTGANLDLSIFGYCGGFSLLIPRDSLRQKFLPQFKKGAFLDLRHFFLICGVFLELRQNLFSVFSPPRFAAEIGGNAAEIGGNAAEIPGKQTVLRRFCFGCGVFLCLRLIFWNAAGISAAMRCGRNFRRRKF